MSDQALEEALRRIRQHVAPYRITHGKHFSLRDYDPADTHGMGPELRSESEELLAQGVRWLAEQQDMLFAQDRWALLLEFQAMDAAGKDGTIKHVMSGVNPQGVRVVSFKQPSTEELRHDFLWRHARETPPRGYIGIFNRSYYEEVLVVRVHREVLERQKLPPEVVSHRIWDERLEDIRAYERYLARNGVIVLKFFLHVSRKEQKKRFLERLDRPEKNWKFSAFDVAEREYWKEYTRAYQAAIRATASKHAPWYVVPADNKWFSRLVVAGAIAHALSRLELTYPKVDGTRKKELASARKKLLTT
jgi:PPK2 family polyphosphate:nucleotide phosphotransferase